MSNIMATILNPNLIIVCAVDEGIVIVRRMEIGLGGL